MMNINASLLSGTALADMPHVILQPRRPTQPKAITPGLRKAHAYLINWGTWKDVGNPRLEPDFLVEITAIVDDDNIVQAKADFEGDPKVHIEGFKTFRTVGLTLRELALQTAARCNYEVHEIRGPF